MWWETSSCVILSSHANHHHTPQLSPPDVALGFGVVCGRFPYQRESKAIASLPHNTLFSFARVHFSAVLIRTRPIRGTQEGWRAVSHVSQVCVSVRGKSQLLEVDEEHSFSMSLWAPRIVISPLLRQVAIIEVTQHLRFYFKSSSPTWRDFPVSHPSGTEMIWSSHLSLRWVWHQPPQQPLSVWSPFLFPINLFLLPEQVLASLRSVRNNVTVLTNVQCASNK